MDTNKLLIIYFHFSASMSLRELLPRLMLMFGKFIFHLLGFIAKHIFRLKTNYTDPGESAEKFCATQAPSDYQTAQNSCKALVTNKYYNQNRGETEDSVFKPESKYVFLSSKNVSAFIIEPKVISFPVEEVFVSSNDVGFTKEIGQFQSEDGFRVLDESSNNSSVYDGFQEFITENVSEKLDECGEISCFEENVETEEKTSTELEILEGESTKNIENSEQNQEFSEEMISLEGENFDLSSSEYTDEIFNLESSTSYDERKLEVFNKCFDGGETESRQEEENCDGEFIELKPCLESHGHDHVEKFSRENVSEFEDLCDKCEEGTSNNNLGDLDEEDECDTILQEHKYLVKRMKMEMRYSKVKGLPTISEECESEKTLVDDLKPLNIDQKLGYKDHMAEIQKFYATYVEKMKKLDILNYQTLHAISFLQYLTSSKSLMGSNKSPISLMKPYIPKLWPYKQHKIYAESKDRLASSTHQDLELIYVGQVCNSWEILSWQYAKVKELLEYDSDQKNHSYNKVASEFQQFQVLVERFLEDEAFHGPRIVHYVKTRCIFRTLLQIPMIKEDCLKGRLPSEAAEEQTSVSLAWLANMIEQSMEVFWEFLSTEKAESKMRSKLGTEVDQHDPTEAKFLKDIRLTLQQKDRKLKDIVRSRNCIVKKFQKYENGAQNHAVLISQVELKLVSKVLNLRKITTEQLTWCQKKLDNHSFLGRKVHVESSFFLLPC